MSLVRVYLTWLLVVVDRAAVSSQAPSMCQTFGLGQVGTAEMS